MLKEGCQLHCGAGTQVSWARHPHWLQAGVCVMLLHPALPTQLSFHFAAQQQNGSCIFLTTFLGSQCTSALDRPAPDLVTLVAASLAPGMVLLAAAGAPLPQTKDMVEETHLVVCCNVWNLFAGPDDALACHGPSLSHAFISVQTNQGLQGVSQHTTGACQALHMHLKYVSCYPILTCVQCMHSALLSPRRFSATLLCMKTVCGARPLNCTNTHARQLSRLSGQGCKDPKAQAAGVALPGKQLKSGSETHRQYQAMRQRVHGGDVRLQRHSVQLPLQAVGCERGMLQHAQHLVPIHACKGRPCHLHAHRRTSWKQQVELLMIEQELSSWQNKFCINFITPACQGCASAFFMASWLPCAHVASLCSTTTEGGNVSTGKP